MSKYLGNCIWILNELAAFTFNIQAAVKIVRYPPSFHFGKHAGQFNHFTVIYGFRFIGQAFE